MLIRGETIVSQSETTHFFNEVRHKTPQVHLEMFYNCVRDASTIAELLNFVPTNWIGN